ncbi:nuclear transport factor 2 family protein [Cupriavidus basilensis]
MTESEVKTLMAAFGTAFRTGDADAVAACPGRRLHLAPAHRHRRSSWPGSPRQGGHPPLSAGAVCRTGEGGGVRFSDSCMEVSGDMVILRYRVRGTGEDGQAVDAMGLDVFRVADGRLVSKDAYWKQVAWPVQNA